MHANVSIKEYLDAILINNILIQRLAPANVYQDIADLVSSYIKLLAVAGARQTNVQKEHGIIISVAAFDS